MSLSEVGKVKLHRILREWAKALKHEAAQHGRPNSFGITEVAREYGLVRRDGYRLGTTRLFELWTLLGGHEKWGSCPTYADGRFYL